MAYVDTNSDPSCKGASVVVANGQTAVNFAGTNFENSLSSVSCVGEYDPVEMRHETGLFMS